MYTVVLYKPGESVNGYLLALLVILPGTCCLRLVVELRNLSRLQQHIPAEFADCCEPDRYRQLQRYVRDRTRFSMLVDASVSALTVAFILAGGFNLIDTVARTATGGEIQQGLLFTGLVLLCSHLVHIPFSAFATFSIEARYGFNRTSPKTFLLDILKVWLLAVVLGGPLLGLMLWVFSRAGSAAWLWCWGAVAIFQLFVVFAAPVFIMPLFNRFTPLPAGQLKTAIERYARAQNFAVRGIFTMDGSRRSTKSNAFFSGLGRFRRIVLLDTLVQKHTTDELVAVLAHEVGHCRGRHVLKQLCLAIAATGLMLYLLTLVLTSRGLFDAFGMEHMSIHAGLVFFGFLYTPIDMCICIGTNALSRRHEFQADAFAAASCAAPGSLICALKKMSLDNLSNLTPHPLKVFLFYSHPPVLARIRRLGKMQELRSRAVPGTVPGHTDTP